MPQTRGLHTAVAAIAIVLPDEPSRAISDAYDDGRVAERILVAATMLGLGSGISWIRSGFQPAVREILGLPDDRIVRTIMSLGHPSEAARRPKAAPGQARRPRAEIVFEERWPGRSVG
jgi:nitroreductase